MPPCEPTICVATTHNPITVPAAIMMGAKFRCPTSVNVAANTIMRDRHDDQKMQQVRQLVECRAQQHRLHYGEGDEHQKPQQHVDAQVLQLFLQILTPEIRFQIRHEGQPREPVAQLPSMRSIRQIFD